MGICTSWSCCCPFHPSIPPFPRDFQLWLLQHQPQLVTGEPGIHPGFHPRIPLPDSSPSHPAGALGQPCHCFPKFPLEEAPRGDEAGTALSWLPRLRLLWFLLGEELGCGNPSLNSQLPGKRWNVISLLPSHPSSGNFPGWDFHGTLRLDLGCLAVVPEPLPVPPRPSQPLEFARRRGMNRRPRPCCRHPAAQATMDLWNKSVERVGKGRLLRPSIRSATERLRIIVPGAGDGSWLFPN